MDPREFHRLAERLSKSGSPAELRSATSRAYYAVYNVCAGWLNPIVPISKGPAAHGQVQKLLANCGDNDLARAASDLGDLHSRRIDADYEMANSNAENDKTVNATVGEANDILVTIDRAFGGPTAQTLNRAIQHYWTQTLREPLKGRPVIR